MPLFLPWRSSIFEELTNLPEVEENSSNKTSRLDMEEEKRPLVEFDGRVENQLVRFVAKNSVNHDAVISQLAGQKNGNIVVKALEKPRATIIIDEEGRIVVHGTHRVEAARAAAKELLLRLGLDESWD